MTPTQRSAGLAVVALAASGFGAHVVASHRAHAAPDDIVFHDGWREVTGAVSSRLWVANLALLLAAVGIVLSVRARTTRHPAEATAMKAIVVAATVAFPVILLGSARALQRRLADGASRMPSLRWLRGLAMASIAGLLLSAAGLQAERNTPWIESLQDSWPSWFGRFWQEQWPDQLRLPALAAGRSWYIPVCLVASVLLTVLLRRSYADPSLLERRLLAILTIGSAVYWIPIVPYLVLSPVALRSAGALAVATVVVTYVVDRLAGPLVITPKP